MPTTVESPPAAPSVATLVVHFVNSIKQVLSTMAGIPVTVGAPCHKKSPAPSYDVSAIISFSGEFVGSMVLSFQQNAAITIVGKFAGLPVPPDSPDFPDAVGELANMIAGSAKASFNSVVSISVPSVIIGSGHTVARLQGVPCVVIPCQTSAGDFAVEINLKPMNAPQAPRSN